MRGHPHARATSVTSAPSASPRPTRGCACQLGDAWPTPERRHQPERHHHYHQTSDRLRGSAAARAACCQHSRQQNKARRRCRASQADQPMTAPCSLVCAHTHGGCALFSRMCSSHTHGAVSQACQGLHSARSARAPGGHLRTAASHARGPSARPRCQLEPRRGDGRRSRQAHPAEPRPRPAQAGAPERRAQLGRDLARARLPRPLHGQARIQQRGQRAGTRQAASGRRRPPACAAARRPRPGPRTAPAPRAAQDTPSPRPSCLPAAAGTHFTAVPGRRRSAAAVQRARPKAVPCQ